MAKSSFSSPASGLRPQASSLPASRGFTLTEMLVVIAIIAVLAALASVAVVRGLDTAKQTRMKVEVDALDAAFKSYKEKYGSYPPCDLRFNNPLALPAIKQHFARAFPRYPGLVTETYNGQIKLVNDLSAAGVDGDNYRPDQAIVFWLQGFSNNVADPILTPDNYQIFHGAKTGMSPVARSASFFDFDKTRLAVNEFRSGTLRGISSAAVPSYFPAGPKFTTTPPGAGQLLPNWSSGSAPYVYFSAHSVVMPGGGTCSFYGTPPKVAGPVGQPANPNPFNCPGIATYYVPDPIVEYFLDAGAAVPFWSDVNGNGRSHNAGVADVNEDWVNPESFQIIAPGGDGKYGKPSLGNARMYPTDVAENPNPAGPPQQPDDEDNVTNFCNKARLGDAKP